jgi:dCMP deaminase
MSRPTKVEMMMGIARMVSLRGTCDRLQVGAAIARDSRVISTGYNGNVSGAIHCRHSDDEFYGYGSEDGCQTAVHAEANALVFAARHGVAVLDAELWTTHLPCLSCAKLIINAGITQVWFEHDYRKREGLELLIETGLFVFRVREDYSTFQVTR